MTIQLIQYWIHHKTAILNLLSQLTMAPLIDDVQFDIIITGLNENHQIFVYIKDDKIVGLITLLIEPKLIHGGACVARIEDLIVDREYQAQGIARELIDFCVEQTKKRNCYKTILTCKSELVSFYEKFGFNETGVSMSIYKGI